MLNQVEDMGPRLSCSHPHNARAASRTPHTLHRGKGPTSLPWVSGSDIKAQALVLRSC